MRPGDAGSGSTTAGSMVPSHSSRSGPTPRIRASCCASVSVSRSVATLQVGSVAAGGTASRMVCGARAPGASWWNASAGRLLPSGDGLGPRVDEQPAERRPRSRRCRWCARRRPAAPAGTRSNGRASQRSPVACGSWSTARSRGTTSLCSSSAAPRTRANRSTPSRTSPIRRSQAPGARSSPAHSVVRAVSDFRSGSGSATVNRGSTGKAAVRARLSAAWTHPGRRLPSRRQRGHAGRHRAAPGRAGRRRDAGPSSVVVRGTEPSTPRSAAAHNASVSCCGSGDASDTAASSLVVAAAYASATASARVESSASSNRSPTSSWGRARSPAAAGRWVVTRVCAQCGQRAERAQSDEPRVPGGAVRPGGSRPPRPRTPVVQRGMPGAAAPPAPTARRARGPGRPGPPRGVTARAPRTGARAAWPAPATAAVNRIRRGSPRMRASQALSRGSAWDRGSRTGAGHDGGYASSPMRTSSRWV